MPPLTAGDLLTLQITLDHVEPPIWRRVVLPAELSVADLHQVIQAVMGWQDLHDHELWLRDGRCLRPAAEDASEEAASPCGGGTPEDEEDSEHEVTLRAVFPRPGASAVYVYDLEDDWTHTVERLDDTPATDMLTTRCIGGARACPPEGSGGPWCYEDLLDDPGEFDPEAFDPGAATQALLALDLKPATPETPVTFEEVLAMLDGSEHDGGALDLMVRRAAFQMANAGRIDRSLVVLAAALTALPGRIRRAVEALLPPLTPLVEGDLSAWRACFRQLTGDPEDTSTRVAHATLLDLLMSALWPFEPLDLDDLPELPERDEEAPTVAEALALHDLERLRTIAHTIGLPALALPEAALRDALAERLSNPITLQHAIDTLDPEARALHADLMRLDQPTLDESLLLLTREDPPALGFEDCSPAGRLQRAGLLYRYAAQGDDGQWYAEALALSV